jgi:NAD+ synthase (glutamine-hydrolysing)
MQIAIAQLNYHIGNFEQNLHKMQEAAQQAKKRGADLILFGELAVCGYPPRDFLEFKDFIDRCHQSIDALRTESHGIGIVVGAPTLNPVPEGKDLFNSAYFLHNGEIIGVQHKALLPTYDIFDEYRYFEPATEFKVVPFKGKNIALSICEDIWNVGNENPLYTVCPLDEMMDQQPDFILNLSASPFSYRHAATRIQTLRANVSRYQIPLFYANHVGAQTDIIFDGGSIVMSPDGSVHDEMPYFSECLRIYSLETVSAGTQTAEQPKEKIPLIHDALLTGIRDYFAKQGFTKAILGLSGGIDSAVTAVLAAKALGPENVMAVLMPSPYSSAHSVDDACALADNLGIASHKIPINSVLEAYTSLLHPYFKDYAANVAEENIQARVRGMILMAMSNKFGHILLNTTNKSEMAVGYGTLYGDLCGGLAVLADLYKTEVYALANFINLEKIIIPEHSITKPPSAELKPGQKDADSLPPYDLLDRLLFQYIENRQGPHDLIRQGFDPALVTRVLKMVNANEFKREQAPPVLRVSNKGFGLGRRLPIVGKYLG